MTPGGFFSLWGSEGGVVGYGPAAVVMTPAPGMLHGELGGPALPSCLPSPPQFPHGKSFPKPRGNSPAPCQHPTDHPNSAPVGPILPYTQL